ncbi:hypothetical protein Dda_4098 [Drechslerella dactyloides]|uniref:PH domain-containing protein n=1 Tax=Drechslerella dactyloides TaxID=74499 RepID=A0AAD6NLR2_DREDA|nr:hypothetical protein Dda_4098 [Drechslerella dactyloides]
MMEGQTRERYGRPRSSRPKQLPKSFLDDDGDDWSSRKQQHSAPLGGGAGRVSSRRGSNTVGPKTAGAKVPSTFLDDDDDGDDEKLWVQRTRGRHGHTRGSEGWRLSIDAGKSFFKDIGSALMSGPAAATAPSSGTTTPKEEAGQDRGTERRARSQSIARSRSRYRKAAPPPKIQTNTEAAPAKPLTAPLSSHSRSASTAKPSTAPPTKLAHEPIPLDLYRQYVTQLPSSHNTAADPVSDSFDSGPKTSGSDSTSSSSDGFAGGNEPARFVPRSAHEPFDPNRTTKVMIVLSKKRQEVYNFKHDTTVGDVLDWACKKETMTLRGAAILIERLPGFGFERALHESELITTVIDAMGGRRDDATLYLDVDVIKSGNLRFKPGVNHKTAPARLVATFYHAKGEDANVKVKSKRYFCLDDAKLTMSRMSSRLKTEKSSHVCNVMDYGVYTVGQYGKKRHFDVPSKCQYIIILKALAQKQMFVDQSRFFHFLATDSQDQYFEWVKTLHDWRSYIHHTKEKTKAAESHLIAKLEEEGVTSSADMTETKLARLLTETKLTQGTKKKDGVTSPVLMSPAMISPKSQSSGLVHGAKNAPTYQSLNDKASTKGSEAPPNGDEFLSTGLLGAAYDKKVEIRNIVNTMDIAAPKSGGLERKGTLIQRAGNRREDAQNNLYTMPKAPKTPVRERSNGEERGRQGSRKDGEMTFYRDDTTSPQNRLQRLGSSHGGPSGSNTSPTGMPGQPKPLLSFDVDEDESFRYKKKITGHGVEVDRNAGPLISHATEPAHQNAISRSISTRMGPGSRNVAAGQRARSATMRATSTKKRFEMEPSFEPTYDPTLKATSTKKRYDIEPAFESTGLLASVPNNSQHGHGIATGRHGASKPLLNMSLNSNFAPGSLLEQQERVREGGPGYKKTTISREVC